MKVLVYGAGVIGSLTIHELMQAGNDVSVVARGNWKKVLEEQGLRIQSSNGKKKAVDHPRILFADDGEEYDVVFSIMQNQQQEALLDTLASVHAKYLVLVGNNMLAGEMNKRLHEKSADGKTILFAFQTTAGLRHEDYVEVVTFGKPELTIGHLKHEMNEEEKKFFADLFSGTDMKLTFMDDMESWYYCHAAFVIPIAGISYINHCDIHHLGWKDSKRYIQAGSEAYGLLQSLGCQIRPKNDEKNLTGIRGFFMTAAMVIVFKTKMGELAITNHCRNAVSEMQFMAEQFNKLRKRNPSYPMPAFDSIQNEMPSWEDIQKEYRH